MQTKALVVIDLQNDITKNYKDIVEKINNAIDRAVSSEMQIAYIKHNNLSASTHTFKPGTHGEKVLHRNVKNSLLSTFYLIIREVGKDLVIHAADHSLFDSDSYKQRHYALRGGHDVRTVGPLISIPLVRIEFLSVLQDANLTDIWLTPRNKGFEIPLVYGSK